jgi:hypothetical protein
MQNPKRQKQPQAPTEKSTNHKIQPAEVSRPASIRENHNDQEQPNNLNQMTTPTPLVFNDVVAAQYLGVQPATLRRWRSLGTGPAYKKLKKAVRYSLEDLQDYLQKQTVAR